MFESRSISFRNSSTLDVKTSLEGLQQLADQGSWRMVLEKAKEGFSFADVAQQLSFRTYSILALMKLRMYGAALDELAGLGNLDSVEYQYETHPRLYPNQKGSMIPFTLRWLHAELPHHLGQGHLTFQRLYALLELCSRKIEEEPPNKSPANVSENQNNKVEPSKPLEFGPDSVEPPSLSSDNQNPSSDPPLPPPSSQSHDQAETASIEEDNSTNHSINKRISVSDSPASISSQLQEENNASSEKEVWTRTWERRKETVIHSLLSHHMLVKQHDIALQWMEYLIHKNPQDIRLLSKYALIQLQIGDVRGAKSTMETIESMATDGPSGAPADAVSANLLQRNRGQVFFALKEFHSALREFDDALGRKPDDVIAANNKAICLMYCQDLLGAIHVLEDMLKKHPSSSIHETLVLNLCSMYELASSNCMENKTSLNNWLMTIAPDDFDLTSTRI